MDTYRVCVCVCRGDYSFSTIWYLCMYRGAKKKGGGGGLPNIMRGVRKWEIRGRAFV